MNDYASLTKAIQKELDNLGDLIDSTAPYVFESEYPDFELMIDSLIQRGFKKDGYKPHDLSLFPPEMLIDDGEPIPLELFFNADYLGTDEKFNCAMTVHYYCQVKKLIKKGKYAEAMPMLTTAFGLIGFAIEQHALNIETSAAMANKQAKSKKKSQERIEHYRQWLLDNRTEYPTNDAASYEIQKMVLELDGIRVSRRQIRDEWLKGL